MREESASHCSTILCVRTLPICPSQFSAGQCIFLLRYIQQHQVLIEACLHRLSERSSATDNDITRQKVYPGTGAAACRVPAQQSITNATQNTELQKLSHATTSLRPQRPMNHGQLRAAQCDTPRKITEPTESARPRPSAFIKRCLWLVSSTDFLNRPQFCS